MLLSANALTILVTISKGKGYRGFRKTGHKPDKLDKRESASFKRILT
jgi:hypothetical protein